MPLTEQQIMSLEAGPEADELAALHVMGWKPSQLHPEGDVFWAAADGSRTPRLHWKPSRSMDCAFQMESELERRGLAGEYAKQMRFMLMKGPNAPKDLDAWEFALIHASPLARVQAALLCVAKETP